MPNNPPARVTWLRVSLVLLFLGGLYEPVRLYLLLPTYWGFHIVVAAMALPAFGALLLAALVGRSSRVVFGAILLTAGGYLVWAVLNLGTLVTLTQPHLVVVLLSSAAVLVMLLRTRTRAYHTGSALH